MNLRCRLRWIGRWGMACGLVVMLGGVIGCEDDPATAPSPIVNGWGDEDPDPEPRDIVGPDIGGQWEGLYYEGKTLGDVQFPVSLTATVTHQSNLVEIVTSLPAFGHHFQGIIDAPGNMWLFDQFDQEDWTTHYGPATTNRIIIADYLLPYIGQGPPPLAIIELWR